ncbi:MAG: hypothetical protein R3F34_00610 [Planctomycetota bacterium]
MGIASYVATNVYLQALDYTSARIELATYASLEDAFKGNARAEYLRNRASFEHRLAEYGKMHATCKACEEEFGTTRPDVVADVLVTRCNHHRLREDWPAMIADAERIIEIATQIGIPRKAAYGQYQRAVATRRIGDLDGAEADYRAVLDAFDEEDATHWAALDGLATIDIERGNFASALERATAAAEYERRTDNIGYLLDTLQSVVRANVGLGRAADARAALDEALVELDRRDTLELGPKPAAELRAQYAEWARVEDELAAFEIASARTDPDRRRAAERGLASAVAWAGRSLAATLGRDPRGSAQRVDVAALLTAELEPRTALIQYAEYPGGLSAYVVTRDGVQRVDLGTRDGIDAAIEAFLSKAIRPEAGAARRTNARRSVGPRARGGRTLLAPLRSALPDEFDTCST